MEFRHPVAGGAMPLLTHPRADTIYLVLKGWIKSATALIALAVRVVVLLILVAITMAPGCAELKITPPVTMKELLAQQSSDANAFPIDIIVLHNLRRVLDRDLPAKERIASLAIVVHLDGDNEAHCRPLATVLTDPGSDEAVHTAVLQFLARRDFPGLAGHVVRSLGSTEDPKLQEALIDWLTRHPQPDILAEIVPLWADAEPADENMENRYRRL
ncbi:MAG: hypothetical protein HQ546_03150, partial [Planctomycetes bacterium]|nr:hypothetical protein [Planctomycetota bacterium]